jgi:radical SAM superfamily enzyme YgiQ (UPF0313 family)
LIGESSDKIGEQLKDSTEIIFCRDMENAVKKAGSFARRGDIVLLSPGCSSFDQFRKMFETVKTRVGKKQYLLPYFMSGHPGCTIRDMVTLAEYIRDHQLYTEQVQAFTPTPMSVSTCMYHTGLDPFTMEPVHVAKGREKQIQRVN